MKGGTFFSGIDAPEVSAPAIDWRWRAEIDRFANAVSEFHRPGVPNLGDMMEADFDGAEPVDVIVFGSPCQSFSVAGKRLGLDDPRGNLALIALAAVGRIQPCWFVFENVPGLLSSDEGRDFGAFLGAVGELGYGWSYRVLDAQYFGVPQRRRRVFVVGYLGDWRPAAAVLFERESLQGHPAPGREAGKGIAGTFSAGAHPGSYNGQDAHNDMLIAHSLRGEGFDASEDGTGRGTPLVAGTLNSSSKANRSNPQPGDPCHTLAKGANPPTVAFSCKNHGADASDISPTLRATPHDGSHENGGGQVAIAIQERAVSENPDNGPGGKGWREDTAYTLEARNKVQAVAFTQNQNQNATGRNTPKVQHGMTVRRLTPAECERLQGFPDNHTRIPWRGKPAEQCPDGPRYKALGNSMAVPVIGWILDRVQKVDAIMQANKDVRAA